MHTWHRRTTLPLSHLHFWVVKRQRFTHCVCVGLSCEREWAPPPTVRLLCWQARAFKYLPHPRPFSLFSLPPSIQPFWLFVLYVQSHLTLRGIFFILLEFRGLSYYSTLHSHFLLIESTQTASFSVHNSRVHSRTNTTYPSSHKSSLRCEPPSTIFPCFSNSSRQYALLHLQPRHCGFFFAGQGSLGWSI